MTVSRGSQGSFGYVQSGILGVHRDQTKWVALKEPPTIEPDITQIDTRTFTPGTYHQSIERLQGMFKWSGSFVMVFHPEEGIEFLKGIFPTITSTELTGAGSGIYSHNFLPSDSIPMTAGFSLTVNEDSKVKYISGAIVTTLEIGAEIDGEVTATVNWIAKKVETASAGTSGTSQGENAVSFSATIVADTSDDFKLAIDGGTAYECTIASGVYTTAATLEAAINAAIVAQSSLNDADGVPEVACYIDSNSKVNFYTADKGTAASVAWTAGSNDANTILGYGTPVESAGAAALATATYSSVAPFTAVDIQISQDSTDICISSFTATFDMQLGPKNCLGHKYMKAVNIEGKRNFELTFAKDYENETQYDAWLANSDVEFKAELRTGTAIVALSGVNYDADMWFKKCRITNSPEPAFNGSGAMTQEVTATIFYEDATYSDASIDVNNTISSI